MRTPFHCRLILLLIVAACAACIAGAEQNPFLPDGMHETGWPTVRGPYLTGHSDEVYLANEWPSDGPPVCWTRSLGKGYSSVVAVDDRVFTQYQTIGGQYVLCLNAASGKTIWEHRYDWAYETTGLYPGPRSTPTVADRCIYFTSPDALIGCLDWDGNLLWSIDLKEKYGTQGTEFGYACSPMVVDNRVFLPLGGQGASMVALDADTGRLIWRSGNDSASYTPAMPISLGDQRLVVGYLEHALCGFEVETGKQLWRVGLSRGYNEHSAWPIYEEPFLWVSAPFQAGWQLFELSNGSEGSVSIRRIGQSTTMSNDVSSSVLADGYVYGFDLAEAQSKAHRPSRGAFRCVDFLTGEVQWSNGNAKRRRSTDFEENRKRQTVGHASVIIADGKLILLTDLGELVLVRASPEQFEELARANVLGGEIGWATPALHRGRLYVRNHSKLVCLHLGRPDFIPADVAANATSLSEISQPRFWDWTGVLGVEPNYAMDPPTRVWLVNWFAAITAAFGGAWLLTGIACLLARRRMNRSRARILISVFAFLFSVFSGPLISRVLSDFVFTWPGCLFVAFVATVYHSKTSRREERAGKSHSDLYAVAAFVLVNVVYFFVCRRLSLLTEWIFLCGYIASVPTLLAARWCAGGNTWKHAIGEIGCVTISWIAFYVGGVLMLSWKYSALS